MPSYRSCSMSWNRQPCLSKSCDKWPEWRDSLVQRQSAPDGVYVPSTKDGAGGPETLHKGDLWKTFRIIQSSHIERRALEKRKTRLEKLLDAVESIEKTVGWLFQTNAYPDLLYVEKNSSNVEKPLSETPIFEVGGDILGGLLRFYQEPQPVL